MVNTPHGIKNVPHTTFNQLINFQPTIQPTNQPKLGERENNSNL